MCDSRSKNDLKPPLISMSERERKLRGKVEFLLLLIERRGERMQMCDSRPKTDLKPPLISMSERERKLRVKVEFLLLKN